jgi:hypothetical protein
VRGVVFWHAWAAGEEGNIDVFFVGALFAGLEAVLADVVAIVGCEDQVGFFEDAVVVEAGD